jgi:RNA polymerase sigma-70 factor (ECF subfamily)
MEDLSDEQLVEQYRAEQGSSLAASRLDELFRRHRTRVAAWCFRLTGEVDSAADLAQDVMLKAFQRLDSFRGDSRFTTWLYSIARNHCMDAVRSRAMRADEVTDAVPEDLADSRWEDFSVTLERRESERVVRQLIRETLDETETKIMTLHYVEELPLDAITRLLGLTNQSGSKAYIVNARRKLGRAVEKWRQAHGTKGGRHGI